jgi:hypothetical protein
MRRVVKFFKPLVGPVLNIFQDPFVRKMSAFNLAIKNNIGKLEADPAKVSITLVQGSLSPITVSEITNAGENVAIVDIGVPTTSNDLPGDKIYGALYSPTSGRWYFTQDAITRGTNATAELDIAGVRGENLDHCVAFAWAARYDGNRLTAISTATADVLV